MSDFMQTVMSWIQSHLGIGSGHLGDLALTLAVWGIVLVARLVFGRAVEHRVAGVPLRPPYEKKS